MAENNDQTGAGAGVGAGAEAPPRTVAYENFQAVLSAKTGLESQVAALRGQLQTLTEKAATVDSLAADLASWKGKAAEAEGKFASYTELSGALGTTDSEIVGLFDSKWKALPEADRPARAAWVASIKAAPEQAPALLRPWLAPAAQAAAPAPAPAAARQATPRVPGTPAIPPAAPAAVTAAEIQHVREEAVRTGNWAPWKELRKTMGIVK